MGSKIKNKLDQMGRQEYKIFSHVNTRKKKN